MRDSRHRHTGLTEALGKKMTGGLPLDGRVERQNDFCHTALTQADQRIGTNLLRPNPINGREVGHG